MTDPEEFQPSGLPDDLSTVEADEADVEEQAQPLAADPSYGQSPSNLAQGSTGPEPDGSDA